MKKQNIDALQVIIDALQEWPNMDEITFANFMLNTFGGATDSVEYEFIHTTSPHLHIIKSVNNNLEITFTWSCAIEVMIELQWFIDHVIKEEIEYGKE